MGTAELTKKKRTDICERLSRETKCEDNGGGKYQGKEVPLKV